MSDPFRKAEAFSSFTIFFHRRSDTYRGDDTLAIIMTLGTLSFLVTTPEVWVPNLGSGEYGFPLLSGAGRLVIKDIVILASAVTLLSDSSQRVLNSLKKADREKRNK